MENNKVTNKTFVDAVKQGYKDTVKKFDGFTKSEREQIVKNLVIALFAGLPLVMVGIPFAYLGLFGAEMIAIGVGIITLVFCAATGFDVVKMYVEDKKERVEYYILIAISSTLILVAYWAFFRFCDYISYGG